MEASLDTWTILFLVAAIQGVFLSIMIFLRKSRTNNLLAALIMFFSITLIYYVAFWTKYYLLLPKEVGALQGLTYLFGPLGYFYIRSDQKNTHFNFLHFIPFLCYVIFYPFHIQLGFRFGFILSLIQTFHLITYTILIFKWLGRNKGFTNGLLKRYLWKRKIAWSFSGYTLSFLAYYLLVWSGLLQIEYDYAISAASTFFIYFIGYHGFQNPDVFKMNESRYNHSALPHSAALSILQKIKQIMAEEKLFLDGSLKLQGLAEKLKLSQNHVSQAINDVEGKNFSDFINEYRVEEAKRLLHSSSNFKLIYIAYDSGFNNKVSFNNAFKKFTGMSPSEFRDHQSEISKSA